MSELTETIVALILQVDALKAEVARLQGIIDGMARRIADQSELLSRKAEVGRPISNGKEAVPNLGEDGERPVMAEEP